MMATQPAMPHRHPAQKTRRSTRGSSRQLAANVKLPGSSRLQPCASHLSADLAGRSVAVSIDVPPAFDAPLAPHHKVVGRWVAAHDASASPITRAEARRHIEQTFDTAVLEILNTSKLINLRVVVLCGDDELPPALAVITDDVGQIDLGWIEKQNVLADTMFGSVAPVGWRAAAYRELATALVGTLPVFGYGDLFEEVSAYYWDGETDDDAARESLIQWQGADPDELGDYPMPTEMNARRPDFMFDDKAAPLKQMPADLAQRIRALRDAYKALKAVAADESAWRFEFDKICEYIPQYEEASHLGPLTLVPFDVFARELDDVARQGMEMGFMDVAGLCAISDVAAIEAWFASLKLGAALLRAAQNLIDYDPAAR